jgi:hypothetical protein
MKIQLAAAAAFALGLTTGQSSVNPFLPFYGSGGTITATPAYPIVGENTHIQVTVGNNGDQPASTVQVKVSFNDWGVTFMGWQEIGTVVIPSIPAGGTATADFNYVFQNRTHTCLEALIVGADQNDDGNDDRGQINLEVINAGETFSYGVPVQNNGDVPLHLRLLGHCKDQDAAGTPGKGCREIAKEVVVAPGEEIVVPIELDLRGVPPGQQINFVLDAYDLGSVNPFAPANHNYIELRVVRETARHLKTKALGAVVAVEALTVNRSLRNQLDAVAGHIQRALDAKLWLDENHLRVKGGARVFAQEKAAMEKLLHLLKSSLPLALKASLNDAVLELTDADRILAQTANQDAGGNPEAAILIELGDQERLHGEYDEAIHAYAEAWSEVFDSE